MYDRIEDSLLQVFLSCDWNLLSSVGHSISILATWFHHGIADVINIFSMRTLCLLGLSRSCSLMSNLAALGPNLSQRYISWSHKAIISGPCAQSTRSILSVALWFIDLWHIDPCWGGSIFAYSALELSSSSSWASGSFLRSDPLVHSLHPARSLLWLCLLQCLAVPPAKEHWSWSQALMCLLVATGLLGIPSWS